MYNTNAVIYVICNLHINFCSFTKSKATVTLMISVISKSDFCGAREAQHTGRGLHSCNVFLGWDWDCGGTS